KHGLLRWKARVNIQFSALIMPWAKHLRPGSEIVRRASDLAHEAGDLMYASYARNCLITLLLAAGDPLAAVQRETEAALAFVRKARFGLVIDFITAQQQLVRSLRGLTRKLGSLDDEELTEARFEQHLEGHPQLVLAAGWYWIRKLQARCLA